MQNCGVMMLMVTLWNNLEKSVRGLIVLVVGLKKRFVSQHVIKRNAFDGKSLESFSRES